MPDDIAVRPCKFAGAVECTRSDRGRADCYVCTGLSTYLSAIVRMDREYRQAVRDRDRLARACADLEQKMHELTLRCDALAQEATRLKEERRQMQVALKAAEQRLAALEQEGTCLF